MKSSPKDKEEKMCEGCKLCDPYSYKVEVDLFFLNLVETVFGYLKELHPDHYAEGWGEMLQDYKNKVKKDAQ